MKADPTLKAAAKAIELLGGPTRAAEALKTTPNVVSNWKVRGVPARYAHWVGELTGISPRVLCPSLPQ